MSKIIGTLNEDQTIKTWPETNINGGSFDHSAIRQSIGGNRFVVLPVGFNEWDRITELKAKHTEPALESTQVVDKTKKGQG